MDKIYMSKKQIIVTNVFKHRYKAHAKSKQHTGKEATTNREIKDML